MTPAIDHTWRHYGADLAGTRFSPAAQINRSNVGRLEIAWTTSLQAPLTTRGSQASTGQWVCQACRDVRYESTPVTNGELLFTSSPFGKVVALDPANGSARWWFDAQVDLKRTYPEGFTSRGVALWKDHSNAREFCAERVIVTTIDGRLIALDARSGKPCSTFGYGGTVHVRHAVEKESSTRVAAMTSPATVIDTIVVVGSVGNQRSAGQFSARGLVQAFDVRNGRMLWSFAPLQVGPDTALRNNAGAGANVWSVMSADPQHKLIFIPTSSASPNHFGGDRAGSNEHANSLVAVDAGTGKVVWAFQAVHHDLWDYDVAAQPVLFDLRLRNATIPAVAIGTKTGMIFVLNRLTGIPLFPIEERSVPQTDVPGERTSLTQPFPQDTALILHDLVLPATAAFGITAEDREFCTRVLSQVRNEGIFTPPSVRGSLVWPGFWGGINWDGLAWDPSTQTLITTLKRLAMVARLQPQSLGHETPPEGNDRIVQGRSGWIVTRGPLLAESGVPCSPPPWAELVAVELAPPRVRWKRALGQVPALDGIAGASGWGSIAFGGAIVTAGGIVFVAASQDDRIRAFDTATGALLWQHQLPAGGQATPMTYTHRGRQYVVVTAGGRSGIGSRGDWVVAFRLRTVSKMDQRSHDQYPTP